jgi:hypothetical protein
VKFTPKHSDFADFSKALATSNSKSTPLYDESNIICASMQDRPVWQGASMFTWFNLTEEEQAAELAEFKAEKRLTPEEQSQLEDGVFVISVGADNFQAFMEHLEKAAANGESLVSAITHWRLNNRSGWANSDWDTATGGARTAFEVCTHSGKINPILTDYVTFFHNLVQPTAAAHKNSVDTQNAALPSVTRNLNTLIQNTFFKPNNTSVFDDVLNMGGAI